MGGPRSAAQLQAKIARDILVRGWLRDRDKGAHLADGARARLRAMAKINRGEWRRFERAREALERAIFAGKVRVHSAALNRELTWSDLAAGLWLDPANDQFTPSLALPLFSSARERASAHAAAIGEISINATDVGRVRVSQRRATAAAKTEARAALIDLCEKWLAGAGPMPRRERWINGLGAELAGSANAARQTWREVRSVARYAALGRPGRRSNRKS